MKKNIDIYVDQLNLITAIIILLKYDRKKIHRIFYDSYFLPKIFRFIWKNIRLVEITKLRFSRIKIENFFFYQQHWKIISKFSNYVFDKKIVFKQNKSFINKYKINVDKYSEHLKETSVIHSYLPIKFFLFASKFSANKKTYYLLSKNPLNFLLESFLKIKITTYINPFYHTLRKRKNQTFANSLHYGELNKNYIAPRLVFIKRIIILFYKSLNGILKKKPLNLKKKICIELVQRNIDFNEVTDFYWAKFSKIKKENFMTISYTKWDKISLKNLNDFGLENFNANELCFLFRDFIKIIFLLPKLIFFLIRLNSFKSWLNFQNTYFLINVIYFESIYRLHNVKYLFSMMDWDDNKFTKAQAIENNNALISYSHWSHITFPKLTVQKCCDILFTWSHHFIKSFHNHYPYKKIYAVGYPSDHYFRSIDILKKDNQNHFIIGYMDNITAADLPFDETHQLMIYKMLLNLLKKYPNVLLYTKPKTKYFYQKIFDKNSEVQSYAKQGKIVPFFNSPINEKMPPAKFSSMCDLVVSLGASTAGAEASFFGTKSFHYDNMELENYNEFCKQGHDKVVFSKIDNLSIAIEKEINLLNNNSVEENKKYHGILDPYQDGRCGERTALIIDTIFRNFDNLSNIDKVLSAVEDEINNNHNLFKKKY